MKQCPFCSRDMQDHAIRCPHCGSALAAGARTGFEDPALAEVVKLLGQGKKIDAIKRVRELYGIGLAEAKTLVDGLARRNVPSPAVPEHTGSAHQPAALTMPQSTVGKPCPSCRNPVTVVAAYCPQCGASLLHDDARSGFPLIKVLLLLTLGALLYYAIAVLGAA